MVLINNSCHCSFAIKQKTGKYVTDIKRRFLFGMHRWTNLLVVTLFKSPHLNSMHKYLHNFHCPFFLPTRKISPCGAFFLSTEVWSIPCSFLSTDTSM